LFVIVTFVIQFTEMSRETAIIIAKAGPPSLLTVG